MTAAPRRMDALFVIHQDTPFERIKNIVRVRKFRQVFILTTHHLLEHERDEIKHLSEVVRIATFAEFLADNEMVGFDNRATEELRPKMGDPNVQKSYMKLFTDRSLRHKNAAVWGKLKNACGFQAIYHSPGLGVHHRFWHDLGGKCLETPIDRFKKKLLPTYKRKIANIIKRRSIQVLCRNTKCYIFVSSTERLRLKDAVTRKSAPISRFHWLLIAFAGIRGISLLRNLLRRETPAGHAQILCCTVHDYLSIFAEAGFPLLVFTDGYHPSNYPRSYMDMFAHCRFVVREMFGEAWFGKYGRKTLKPLPFMASTQMIAPTRAPYFDVKAVLLALNHAGDWTALINRSDTDLLVEAFCRLAHLFPRLDFLVRPHPTMAKPEHEGIHSFERISNYVKGKMLKNLSVSDGPLSLDLEKADLVMSEYSQVLIDAYGTGKLGLTVNLTGRRSFMDDYERLGFPAVDSFEGLREWLRDLVKHPQPAIRIQQTATDNYNQCLMSKGYI